MNVYGGGEVLWDLQFAKKKIKINNDEKALKTSKIIIIISIKIEINKKLIFR